MKLVRWRCYPHVLDSPVRVLGTIAMRSIPFTDAIKARSDIELIHVKPDNREQLATDLIRKLSVGSIVLR
jgi:nucleoside-triphosphatase THEP1